MRTMSSWRIVRKELAAASCISTPATWSTSCYGDRKRVSYDVIGFPFRGGSGGHFHDRQGREEEG